MAIAFLIFMLLIDCHPNISANMLCQREAFSVDRITPHIFITYWFINHFYISSRGSTWGVKSGIPINFHPKYFHRFHLWLFMFLPPLGLEIFKEVPTPKGLNVKLRAGTLIATDEIGGTKLGWKIRGHFLTDLTHQVQPLG